MALRKIVKLKNVYFGFDSAVLLATAKSQLDVSASMLKRNPEVTVEIAGYADARGPESYNLKLSEQRAEAVRDYLAQKGIDASRMTVRGYGESQPTASNDTAAGQAKNRRVEVRVTGR